MQEFSSVTASSYDAESLAPLLNEKAADGWSVVSIVAAGTNIVAYLQREADEAAAPADETPASDAVTTEAPAATDATTDESAADSPFVPAAAAAACRDRRCRRHARTGRGTGWLGQRPGRAGRTGRGRRGNLDRRPRRTGERARTGCRRTGRSRAGRSRTCSGRARSGRTGRGTGSRVGRARRLVRRPLRSVRAPLLGRRCMDRARVARRPAVHRPAGRLNIPTKREGTIPRRCMSTRHTADLA